MVINDYGIYVHLRSLNLIRTTPCGWSSQTFTESNGPCFILSCLPLPRHIDSHQPANRVQTLKLYPCILKLATFIVITYWTKSYPHLSWTEHVGQNNRCWYWDLSITYAKKRETKRHHNKYKPTKKKANFKNYNGHLFMLKSTMINQK